MRYYPVILTCLFFGLFSAASAEDQTVVEERVLTNRLNNLESQAVQRRGRAPSTFDLLNRQDDKIAGQTLNRLKTENPRSSVLPRLERKLDRSRRFGR
jgi:hypothetical protein